MYYLYKNKLLFFDYFITSYADNKNLTSNDIILFINRNIVYNIAEKMSSIGWFISLYDSNSGAKHVYKEGIMYSYLEKKWNYDNYLDILKNLANNDQIFKYICNEYVIISIAQPNFLNKNLFEDLLEISNKII